MEAYEVSIDAEILDDLCRWTVFDRGGYFAAFEEPELLGADLNEFLAGL
jgi:hypothetical protein